MTSITYNLKAKAMYVFLDKRKLHVAKTIPLGKGNFLDVTETNEPVGLEIILPRGIPREAVDAIVNRSKSKIEVKS